MADNYGLPKNPATTTEMYFHAVVMELQALNLSVAQLVAVLKQAQPVAATTDVVDEPELDTVELIEPEPKRKGRKARA